jgi:hypothetical protein
LLLILFEPTSAGFMERLSRVLPSDALTYREFLSFQHARVRQ